MTLFLRQPCNQLPWLVNGVEILSDKCKATEFVFKVIIKVTFVFLFQSRLLRNMVIEKTKKETAEKKKKLYRKELKLFPNINTLKCTMANVSKGCGMTKMPYLKAKEMIELPKQSQNFKILTVRLSDDFPEFIRILVLSFLISSF